MARRKPHPKATRKNSRRKTKEPTPGKRARNKAVIQIRSVLGAAVFNQARVKYGEKKINDLAEVLAKKLDKQKQKELRKARHGNPADALAEVDKKRHLVVKEINYRRGPEVRFFRRKDGRYDKIVGRKRAGVVSAAVKKRYESMKPYQKMVRLVSGVLDLSKKEARSLIAAEVKHSQRELAKFKRSKKFKKMSKRRQRRYTKEQTKVSALLRLKFVLTGAS